MLGALHLRIICVYERSNLYVYGSLKTKSDANQLLYKSGCCASKLRPFKSSCDVRKDQFYSMLICYDSCYLRDRPEVGDVTCGVGVVQTRMHELAMGDDSINPQ